MARPKKEGLDYFPLDVDIDQDDKIALIEAKHGLIGFGIVVKLFMKIYKNSYFYQWGEKEQLLFSKQVNVNINEVNVIINDCIKWNLFNENLFNTKSILTSSGIQKRYAEASSRRNKVILLGEYLLIPKKEVNEYKNLVIEYINTDSKGVNDYIGTQSKVKESKVNKTIESINNNTAFQFYQNNFGMINSFLSDEIGHWIDDLSEELVIEAMKRSLEQNKRSWGYVKGILNSWVSANVKNLEDVNAIDFEFKNKGGKKNEEKPKSDNDKFRGVQLFK